MINNPLLCTPPGCTDPHCNSGLLHKDLTVADCECSTDDGADPSWTLFADGAGNIVCGHDPCPTHFGPYCDKVPTCKHGTPSVGVNGTGNCTGDCNPNWAGPNCDDCDANHTGSDCSIYTTCNGRGDPLRKEAAAVLLLR